MEPETQPEPLGQWLPTGHPGTVRASGEGWAAVVSQAGRDLYANPDSLPYKYMIFAQAQAVAWGFTESMPEAKRQAEAAVIELELYSRAERRRIECDDYLMANYGTETVKEIVDHPYWPEFAYEMRHDGLTAIRFPDDEGACFLVEPEELGTLLVLRAGNYEVDQATASLTMLERRLPTPPVVRYITSDEDGMNARCSTAYPHPLVLEYGGDPRCACRGDEPDCPEGDGCFLVIGE